MKHFLLSFIVFWWLGKWKIHDKTYHNRQRINCTVNISLVQIVIISLCVFPPASCFTSILSLLTFLRVDVYRISGIFFLESFRETSLETLGWDVHWRLGGEFMRFKPKDIQNVFNIRFCFIFPKNKLQLLLKRTERSAKHPPTTEMYSVITFWVGGVKKHSQREKKASEEESKINA